MKDNKKWTEIVTFLKEHKQKIIAVSIGVAAFTVCLLIILIPNMKKKNNNVETDVSQSYVDNNTNKDNTNNDVTNEDTSQEEDSDPQKEENEENGAEVVAASLPGDNSDYSNGIDVSKWQGKIDWKKVAASGVDYAIIRVGYRTDINGTICEDEYASYNLISAQAAGIKTGVYFFSTAVNEEEAMEEAEWVTDYIAGYSITYPVVYNCEDYSSKSSRMYDLSNEQRTNNAIAFMQKIEEEGYDAMLYSGKNELVGNVAWDVSVLEQKYPIWIAAYSDGAYPAVLKPDYDGACGMWQYTNRGVVDGITGYVDMNVAYFSYDEDAQPEDSSKTPVSVNEAELGIVFKSVNEEVTAKEETNLRTSPDIRGEISDVLYNGDTALRTGIGDNGWSRLEYEGKTLYAITSYLTTDLESKPTVADNGNFYVNDMEFSPYSDNVTAKEETNLRTLPSTDTGEVVVTLKSGEYVKRIAKSVRGWSQVEYNGQKLYAVSSYLMN